MSFFAMAEKKIREAMKEKEGKAVENKDVSFEDLPTDPDVVQNNPKFHPKVVLFDVIEKNPRFLKDREMVKNPDKRKIDEQGKQLKRKKYLKKQKEVNESELNSDADESNSDADESNSDADESNSNTDLSEERESSDPDDGDVKAKKVKREANDSGEPTRQPELDEISSVSDI